MMAAPIMTNESKIIINNRLLFTIFSPRIVKIVSRYLNFPYFFTIISPHLNIG